MADYSRYLRIQSDGTGPGTVITDSEGNVLKNVLDATVYLDAREVNTVSLTIQVPKIDAHGSVTDVTLQCSFCDGFETHECTPLTLGGS